ncbi:MAG: transposase [Paludibaculum sp.]
MDLGRATLDNWMTRVDESLLPVMAAMGREVLARDYIQADETAVDAKMYDSQGGTIIRLIFEITANRVVVLFSISGRGVVVRVRNNSLVIMKEFCRPMDMQPMKKWARRA